MTTTGKHTAGPCKAVGKVHKVSDDYLWCGEILPQTGENGYRGPIAAIQSCQHIDGISNDEAEANAHFIAEAFNVAHETGLTPRRLAEQRKDLLAALKYAREMLDSYKTTHVGIHHEALSRAHAAIAKAEGGAA